MVLRVYAFIRSLIDDQRGQGMVEYGLIIALVALVVIVALTTLGTNLQAIFENIATELTAPLGG